MWRCENKQPQIDYNIFVLCPRWKSVYFVIVFGQCIGRRFHSRVDEWFICLESRAHGTLETIDIVMIENDLLYVYKCWCKCRCIAPSTCLFYKTFAKGTESTRSSFSIYLMRHICCDTHIQLNLLRPSKHLSSKTLGRFGFREVNLLHRILTYSWYE